MQLLWLLGGGVCVIAIISTCWIIICNYWKNREISLKDVKSSSGNHRLHFGLKNIHQKRKKKKKVGNSKQALLLKYVYHQYIITLETPWTLLTEKNTETSDAQPEKKNTKDQY